MARRQGRSEGPLPISSSLEQFAARLSKKDLIGFARVQQAFEEVIDPLILEHARPLKLEGATLVIAVEEPSRATQLRLLSGEIMEALNAERGVSIDRIEVVLRRV